MVTIDIAYLGELRSQATHQPSGTVLITDAPKDNKGKGESFSPTDLVATALGACILTVMGIAAQSLKIDITGTQVTVQKEMATAPMRRIAKLSVSIRVPVKLSEDHRQKLEHAAHTCPVHKSLHTDIAMPIEFSWV